MKNSFFSHYFENIPKTSGLYGDYNKHRQKMKIKEKRQLMSSMQTPSVVVPPVKEKRQLMPSMQTPSIVVPPVTHHQKKNYTVIKEKQFSVFLFMTA